MMKFSRIVAIATVFGSMTFGVAIAQETVSITIGAGHPPRVAAVEQAIATFIPEVDRILAKSGNYKIRWNEAWAGTIAKPKEVFEAVEAGLMDVAVVPVLFESSNLPLETLTYIAPFGSQDLTTVVSVMKELHDTIPAYQQAWKQRGQLYLASAGLDTYHIITNFEIKTLADLKGRKIGTGGAAANWLSGTGATAVSGNLTTYYNDIKNGVYDGAIVYGSAVAPFKLQEVAPYYTEVNFGAMVANALSVNLKAWDKMPEEVQTAIRQASKAWQEGVTNITEQRFATNFATIKANGAIISTLPEAERAKWAMGITNVAKDWAAGLDARGVPGSEALAGYMNGLRKLGSKPPRGWDQE